MRSRRQCNKPEISATFPLSEMPSEEAFTVAIDCAVKAVGGGGSRHTTETINRQCE